MMDSFINGLCLGAGASLSFVIAILIWCRVSSRMPDKWAEHRKVTEGLLERKVVATEKIAECLFRKDPTYRIDHP